VFSVRVWGHSQLEKNKRKNKVANIMKNAIAHRAIFSLQACCEPCAIPKVDNKGPGKQHVTAQENRTQQVGRASGFWKSFCGLADVSMGRPTEFFLFRDFDLPSVGANIAGRCRSGMEWGKWLAFVVNLGRQQPWHENIKTCQSRIFSRVVE
jgi:hypothetical protein